MNYTDQEELRKREEELRAWDEWKKICAVDGCTPESRRTLVDIIGKAFKRKVTCKVPWITDAMLGARMGVGGDELLSALATEFDTRVLCRAEVDSPDRRFDTESGRTRQKKKYKNIVWDAIPNGSDEKLKIIRGMLLGKENHASAMNDIADDFICEEFGRGFSKIEKSLNEPLSDGSGRTLMDTIPAMSKPLELSPEEERFLKDEVDRLSLAEVAVLYVAAFQGKSLDSHEVLEFISMGKSAAYELQKKTLKQCQACIYNNFECKAWSAAARHIKNLLVERIKAEKCGNDLLMYMGRE